LLTFPTHVASSADKFATDPKALWWSKTTYRTGCQSKPLIPFNIARSGPPGFPTPAAAVRGAARKRATTRDLICVCEDWPCRIPRNRMTSGRVYTA
jgi:hypothetical protein